MLTISINRETGQARLAQSTAIKAGGMVPVRVEFSTSPGSNPVIELALSPQSSEREVLAYLDVFAPENSTTYLGLLDANDTRLMDHLEEKGVASTTLDVEVVVFAGGVRRPFPNFGVTVQTPTITGPASSEGGPVYLTLAQGNAAYASKGGDGTVPNEQLKNATTSQRGIAQLASDAEIQTGTDAEKVVPVSGLAAWWAWAKTQVQIFTQLLAPRMVRTSAFTAAIGGRYVARGTFPIADPPGTAAGQEYDVVIASGSPTIGGVALGPSRFPVVRQFNGSVWETLPQSLTGNLSLPTATFGSNNALTGTVGDARYRGAPALLNPMGPPLRFGTTMVELANSGAPWGNWARLANSAWVELQFQLNASTAAGWSRGGFYSFGLLPGGSSTTPTTRPFTFLALANLPPDNAGGLSTQIYFGAQGTEQGLALAARGLRVGFVGNGTGYAVTAAIHNGTSEVTGTGTVSAINTAGGLLIRWLPVGGTPGAGSRLEVWARAAAGDYVLIAAAELTASIGAALFAGNMFLVAARTSGTSPGYTANWQLGGCTTYWH